MFHFLNTLIKSIVAVVMAVVAGISGIFVQAPPPQASSTVVMAPPVQEVQLSPSSSIQVAPKPQEKKVPIPKFPAATTPAPVAPAPVTVQVPVPVPAPEVNPLPPQNTIDPETFVGILCYFNAILSSPSTGATLGTGTVQARGSGVIVNSKGNILTNRHVVAPSPEQTTVSDSNGNPVTVIVTYQRDHCAVGQLPKGTHLPTVDEIKAINPLVRIPVLSYNAQVVYLSSSLPLSDAEAQFADFAILAITGLSADAATFGVTSIPASFPYAKLLPIKNYPLEKEQVITYGFPGDVTAGMGEAFSTLTMTGSVGRVTEIQGGDLYYRDIPLVILTDLQITHGRSGSPLFWRGYVIGLTTFFIGENKTNSGSVASDAIVKGLQGTGYLGL